MNRGLALKCLQCDNEVFHILYTMEHNLAEFHTRNNREAMSVSSVAMPRTKRSKRPWWPKSSGNVRRMTRA